MDNVVAWIVANYGLVLGAFGALLLAAAAIAKLTPTKKDDEVIEKIQDAFDKVEDVVTPDEK